MNTYICLGKPLLILSIRDKTCLFKYNRGSFIALFGYARQNILSYFKINLIRTLARTYVMYGFFVVA